MKNSQNLLLLFFLFLFFQLQGEFSEYQNPQEALHALKDSKDPGEIYLTLNEYEDLVWKSAEPEEWIQPFEMLAIDSWPKACRERFEEVKKLLRKERLLGRPSRLGLLKTYDMNSELLDFFSWEDLSKLSHSKPDLTREFDWVGSELIEPSAVQKTDKSRAHHFQAVLEVSEPETVVLEVLHKGAWLLRVGSAIWFQSKLGSSVPDRALFEVTLPRGRIPIDWIVDGAHPFDLRLKENESSRFCDFDQPFQKNAKVQLKPKELPVLAYIKDHPQRYTRWLLQQNMGDLLGKQADPWLESLRILRQSQLPPRKQISQAQRVLSLVIEKNPKHVEALVWLAQLARGQSLLSQANHYLGRALSVGPENPRVLVEAIQISLIDQRLLRAKYFLKKLKKRAPLWHRTFEMELLCQFQGPPGDEQCLEKMPVELMRKQARLARSLEVRLQAHREISKRCPWEAESLNQVATLTYQKNQEVLFDSTPPGPAREEIQRLRKSSLGFEDPFEEFSPKGNLFRFAKKFPDSDSALLYDFLGIHFDVDGSAHEVIHQLIRIHGEEGVREWGHIPLTGEPEILRVLTPDGREWIPLIIPGEREVTLPRLEPGTLIEMRTHRMFPKPWSKDYDSTPFYFRDPDRLSTLSHSLVVVQFVKGKIPQIVEHRLEDLSRGSEMFLKHEMDKGIYRQKIWESREMKPLRKWPHRQPIEEELPWVRIASSVNSEHASVAWLYGSDLWTQSDRSARQLAESLLVNTLDDEEKIDRLASWHRKNVSPGSHVRGIWTLQERGGDLEISLTTLFKAAGLKAHVFHCRPKARFYDDSDAIERQKGMWPGRGVVVWAHQKPHFFVPSKPWLGKDEIPEAWRGQVARYWDQKKWQRLTLPDRGPLSREIHWVTLDLTRSNFEFLHEREGDSLESWQDLLWNDPASKENLGGVETFESLLVEEEKWLRPSPGRLQYWAHGRLDSLENWSLPPLKVSPTWLPEGLFPAPLWISTDRVTQDVVHMIFPEGKKVENLFEPFHQSVPGFSIDWKQHREENEIWIIRTWRHQAGLIKPKRQRDILKFLRQVDLMDQRRWRIK